MIPILKKGYPNELLCRELDVIRLNEAGSYLF